MGEKRVIISFGLDTATLRLLDKLIEKKEYATRSEAIRDALYNLFAEVFDRLVNNEEALHIVVCYISDWNKANAIIGTLKHQHKDLIFQSFHYHKADRVCIEIILLSGENYPILEFISKLRGTRSIKYIRHIRIPLIPEMQEKSEFDFFNTKSQNA